MPYQDGVGKWTVGYGHLIISGDGCAIGSPITMGNAETLLRNDLWKAEDAIKADVRVTLTQCQFDALVSFIFNLGTGAFYRSTLLKLLNTGDFDGAASEFPKWDHAPSDTVNNSILKRRLAEKRCFRGVGYAG